MQAHDYSIGPAVVHKQADALYWVMIVTISVMSCPEQINWN